MACLHRDPATADWAMRIVSEPTMGRTAQQNVGDLINWLHAHPAMPLPQVAPGGARMLARTPTASAAMMAAHPSGRIVVGEPSIARRLSGQLSGTHLGAVPAQPPMVQGQPMCGAGVPAQVPMGMAVPMGQPP